MHAHHHKQVVYDLLGIGIGPFNLSLAALAHTLDQVKTVFFEKNAQFNWHPGLLFDNSQVQVPFLADLVTLASPTHPLSFLNYLHAHARMYKFYFRENFHISRQEYNHYCQWVAQQLNPLHFNHRITRVERDEVDQASVLRVTVKDTLLDQEKGFVTKHVAIGVGSEPYIPEKLRQIESPYIQHSAHFLHYQEKLRKEQSICVIGSGQSAAEIVLELLNEYDRYPRRITWVTRSRGFFPMEYSKLGLEHFSPDYTHYFYHLDEETKAKTVSQQDLMYKGISAQTIADIFDKIYQLTIANKDQPLQLIAHSDLESIETSHSTMDHRFTLHFNQWQKQETFTLPCDAVILATGYRAASFDFLHPLKDELITNAHQAFALNNDFSIKTKSMKDNKLFVQNNSLFSHGVGSSDLGLICHRNSLILNQITNKECYPIHTNNNVFQQFHLPSHAQEKVYENNAG